MNFLWNQDIVRGSPASDVSDVTHPTVPRPGFPASPCVDICRLDRHDYCEGCLRSLQEIVDWSRMSAAEQWAVVNALPARRRRHGP